MLQTGWPSYSVWNPCIVVVVSKNISSTDFKLVFYFCTLLKGHQTWRQQISSMRPIWITTLEWLCDILPRVILAKLISFLVVNIFNIFILFLVLRNNWIGRTILSILISFLSILVLWKVIKTLLKEILYQRNFWEFDYKI